MQKFSDSGEAAFRRLIRAAISQGPFTKSQRDVTLAFFNHWLHHKASAKGFVHPSREALAKGAGCTVKTVSRTLGLLRAAGVISPMTGLRAGQGKSVQYKVKTYPLFCLCGMDWTDELLRHGVQNVPLKLLEMSRQSRDKMSHCLTDVKGCPDQGKVFSGDRDE